MVFLIGEIVSTGREGICVSITVLDTNIASYFSMEADIFVTEIIVPFLYHHSLTLEIYTNLLKNHLEAALDVLLLTETQDSWFQQDGTPAHNSSARILVMKIPRKMDRHLLSNTMARAFSGAFYFIFFRVPIRNMFI